MQEVQQNNERGSRSDGNEHDLQRCVETLETLLVENLVDGDENSSNSLRTDQIDAIRQLYVSQLQRKGIRPTVSLAATGVKKMPQLLSMGSRNRLHDTLEKWAQNAPDKAEVSTYSDVMDAYGGRSVFQDVIKIKRDSVTKEIRLRPDHNRRRSGGRLEKLVKSTAIAPQRHLTDLSSFDSNSDGYCPPEWDELFPEDRVKVANMLSLESLSRWSFNVVELAKLTNHPLLFVGWALLCEGEAQISMRTSIGGADNRESSNDGYYLYQFEQLSVRSVTVCNFLREVERRYNRSNPFHNNIHAADVTQTTHCLFQMMDEKTVHALYDPVQIFSTILAATFHDIHHPATNNLFQENSLSKIAIQYNGVSILENMHSATGNAMLFGEDKIDGCDIFEDWKSSDRVIARKTMTKAILSTDMSNHVAEARALESLIHDMHKPSINMGGLSIVNTEGGRPEQLLSFLSMSLNKEGELGAKSKELSESLIAFIMHAADISNPTKSWDLVQYWGDNALDEFFAQGMFIGFIVCDNKGIYDAAFNGVTYNLQLTHRHNAGDKEKELGLPVSPLCDRTTTQRASSQIGFIKFIIQPTYEILAELLPRLNEEVLPSIEENLAHWREEKVQEEACWKQ